MRDDSFPRDGVLWRDDQQRLGFVYFCRTLAALLAAMAVCAVLA